MTLLQFNSLTWKADDDGHLGPIILHILFIYSLTDLIHIFNQLKMLKKNLLMEHDKF